MMSSSLPLAPIMVPNSSSVLSSASKATGQNGSNNSSKIPFGNSRTMDECRMEVVRKFRKEIVTSVRFCDVSRVLISCGLVSKEECFEICKLPMQKQMAQCFQKVHDIMDILVCQKAAANEKNGGNNEDGNERRVGSQRRVEETDKQNGLVKDIWKNFVSALRAEHAQLAGKMENELDRSAESRLLLKRESGSTRSLLRKEDIGCPRDFQHVLHYGLVSDKRRVRVSRRREEGDGAAAVVTAVAPNLPDMSPSDENNRIDDNKSGAVPDLDENDEDLKEFFQRAGVVSRHLLNPATKQIIFRFIAENGGMDAIREEVRLSSVHSELQRLPELPQESTKHNPSPTNHSISPIKHEDDARFKGGIFCGRSNSEIQLIKRDDDYYTPPSAPATVPFRPTPRPTSNLFYF